MTAQGSSLTRFRRALERDNLLLAEMAVRELPHVTLPDALALVALYASQGSPKFDRAAVRWLARYALERDGVTLGELQLAAAALVQLRERPETARPVLTVLVR